MRKDEIIDLFLRMQPSMEKLKSGKGTCRTKGLEAIRIQHEFDMLDKRACIEMGFINPRINERSAKPHRCCICSNVIAAGQPSVTAAYKTKRGIQSKYYCYVCGMAKYRNAKCLSGELHECDEADMLGAALEEAMQDCF